MKPGDIVYHKLLGKCLIIAFGPESSIGGLLRGECRIRLPDGSILSHVREIELTQQPIYDISGDALYDDTNL